MEFSNCGQTCGQRRFLTSYRRWGKCCQPKCPKGFGVFRGLRPEPGPHAPKAGALPTAQHPDMKLWDCPGVSSQSKRATNCATPGYEVVRRSGRILLNCAILSHMDLENNMGIQTSSAVLDWSMCWYMQDWIFISIPLSSPGKYPLAKPEDIFLQFEPYSCRRRSTTE